MQKITKEEIREATKRLLSYKAFKAEDDSRMKNNEKWWRMEHWDTLPVSASALKPRSAWLFNSIINKHADAMDNRPAPTVLPRSRDDKEAAKLLSAVLPVILENCDFEKVYSDVWWDKLKYGTGAIGVFWNSSLSSGLGDVEIKRINPINLYFEPGVLSVQDSCEVFYLETLSADRIKEISPDADLSTAKGILESEDAPNRYCLVNWYYKKGGVLHFAKFVGDNLLFSSENDKNYESTGWYSHGKFPFVLDTVFPTMKSPLGFGYIDTMKDSQMFIDLLSRSILENAMLSSKKRFFIRDDGSINENEFLDFSNPIIHSSGNLGEDSIREFTTSPLSSVYMAVLNSKIDEIKETSGNRDFSQGSTSSGVTAASAIAALQEAGNKLSRDMLSSSNRAFREECYMIIELIRQFYSAPRVLRITGDEFQQFDNSLLLPQSQGEDFGISYADRVPVFDIVVHSEKGSPMGKTTINALAKEFFQLGFFSPERAKEAFHAVSMMDFEGKEDVLKSISENIVN